MFREFEKRYGSTLPSFIGDFTPYWEDGAASSAFETALNRQAADKLIQGEALWSMISPESYPENEYYSAWRNVILYDEHTWGAHNSISEPDIPFVKGQWKIKRQFALDAESLSLSLIDKALKSPGPTKRGETAIDIYNTNSWPRSDVVILSEAQSSAGDLIVDERGDSVPSQRLSSGELAVFAEDVSPMSSERFFVRKGKAYNRGDAKAFGNVLENGLIGLSVDERTGAVQSLKWKKNDVEFVDAGKGFGMNQYLYVLGKNPKDAQKVRNVKIRVKEKGNLLASLAVEAEAPGCERYSYEARLYRGLSRVDIINEIDKRAVRDKEGVHIGFPFNVSNGQVRYDVANGIVRPEEDQLPGSCKNFFSVQNWVDVSNDEYGITWATVDAPLIEIGSITAEQPWMRSIEPTQLIYSYIMNNYWHTNYKADQEGPLVFRYSLFPHADFKAEEAVRFGRERREPLMAVVADASKKATSSLFSVEPTGVQVSSVKPIGGGRSWLLYLYNPTSKNQKTTLKWREGDAVKMHLSDAFGDLGVEIGNDFPVPAFGSSHVRVDRIK
jgi:alpha-mannosidase